MKTISFIIPAYNEEKRIAKTLDEILDYFSEIQYEIIVIIDGCTDNTIKIVNDYELKYDNIVSSISNKRLGKGAAILSGINISCGKVIVILDADNSVSLRSVERMMKLVPNPYEGVIASRHVKGSVIKNKQPILRRFLSRGFNILVRVMFNLKYKDTQCGCKVLYSNIARRLLNNINSKGFAYDVEMLFRLKRMGYTIVEVPVEWTYDDSSSMSLKLDVFKMFYEVIKLRIVTLIKY